MASSFSRFAQRSGLPAMGAALIQHHWTSCDEAPSINASKPVASTVQISSDAKVPPSSLEKRAPAQQEEPLTAGMRKDDVGTFNDLIPMRQLWQPKAPYPIWDDNWDGRKIIMSGDKEADSKRIRQIRKEGVTRHIILIRHGQYDETHQEDEKRILTDIGKAQAHHTGKRLAEMVKGVDEQFGPCNVKVLRVSGMARAKETADIISSYIPDVKRAEPDDSFNEGRPSHHIPGGIASPSIVKKIDEQHPRIEEAFNKIFHRANLPKGLGGDTEEQDVTGDDNVDDNEDDKNDATKEPQHEFEIVVCHANLLRYFFCRALQLPPEAWLRLCTFNCSLTYLTIRASGTVSCRQLGDIGHLPYDLCTFSGRHGYNW